MTIHMCTVGAQSGGRADDRALVPSPVREEIAEAQGRLGRAGKPWELTARFRWATQALGGVGRHGQMGSIATALR